MWYLIIVLIFISLMINNVEHLFMCLLAIYISSLEKCIFRSFPTFWLGCLFFWYGAEWAICMFWRLILCQLFCLLLFSPFGEGNGNPLRCSCLENPRDGGAWWTAVHGVAQSRTWLKWLSSSSSSRDLYCPQKCGFLSVWRLLLSFVCLWTPAVYKMPHFLPPKPWPHFSVHP